MKFKDFKYERVDLEKIKEDIKNFEIAFENATSSQEQVKIFKNLEEILNEFSTMSTLTYVRHTLNTNDEFYAKEQEFFDENAPLLQSYTNSFMKKMAVSKFRTELEKTFGELFFKKIDNDLKIFSEEIIEDLQLENKLCSEYIKLVSNAKIEFDGEVKNLSQMSAYLENPNRDIRKNASQKIASFYYENMKEFDEIYDKLVKTRDAIAKKLGFNNFIELAYLRMERFDYNAKDVENYRKQIKEIVVPLASKLREAQMKRINLDKLKIYDESIKYLDGNARPKGDKDWMVSVAQNMYKELSKETGEFFDLMIEKELMDLDSRAGKQGGGYCTSLEKYKLPFIYANFNGTAGDVEVLTHEAGHAFQAYTTMKHIDISAYYWPSSESAEIHSMSMEFLTWPWMKDFFKEDVEKFKYNHLSSAILFLPYGALVDEFQHEVFKNPQMSPKDRRDLWLKLEKEYQPFRDYGEIKEYQEGILWFKQMHIFEIPFYYIDYTLAQVVALQFWNLANEDRNLAWDKYIKLCKLGGSKTFLNLLKSVDLRNPFENLAIKDIIKPIEKYLEKE